MPQSYSLDLRTRVAEDYEDHGNAKAIAAKYDLGVSTVYKYVDRYRHQDLAPKSTANTRQPLIPDVQLPVLQDLVAQHPDVTLLEYCALWETAQGVKVSQSVMHRAMRRAKITLKKRRSTPSRKTPPAIR